MSSKNMEKNQKPVYLNKSAPIEERVKDLLKTLEEKVYQMCAIGDCKADDIFVIEAGGFSYEFENKRCI